MDYEFSGGVPSPKCIFRLGYDVHQNGPSIVAAKAEFGFVCIFRHLLSRMINNQQAPNESSYGLLDLCQRYVACSTYAPPRQQKAIHQGTWSTPYGEPEFTTIQDTAFDAWVCASLRPLSTECSQPYHAECSIDLGPHYFILNPITGVGISPKQHEQHLLCLPPAPR